ERTCPNCARLDAPGSEGRRAARRRREGKNDADRAASQLKGGPARVVERGLEYRRVHSQAPFQLVEERMGAPHEPVLPAHHSTAIVSSRERVRAWAGVSEVVAGGCGAGEDAASPWNPDIMSPSSRTDLLP